MTRSTGKSILQPVVADQSVIEQIERLRLAMFDGITEADTKKIIQKIVDKAKSGDLKAADFLIKYLAGGGAGQQPLHLTQNNYELPPPDEPTRARPGSLAKVDEMRRRVARGKSPSHKDDFTGEDDQ